MRKPGTQNLSDGELFSIIRNGVRLTGDAETWKLTPREMERLNPKTPSEWEEMKFLEGETHR